MSERELDSSINDYIETETPKNYVKQLQWDMAIGLQEVDNLKPSKYLEKLFDGYNKSYIIDTIYNITINPKFKYWFDCRAYDSDAYKLIWRPISTTFNGLYEMTK